MKSFKLIVGAGLLFASCGKQQKTAPPPLAPSQISGSLAQEISAGSQGRMRLHDVRITETKVLSKGLLQTLDVRYTFEVELTEDCLYWGRSFLKRGVPIFETWPATAQGAFTSDTDAGRKGERFTFPGRTAFALTQTGWVQLPGHVSD